MKRRFGLAAIGFWLLTACGGGPAFVEAPEVQQNPNSSVPLAAVLTFEADRPVDVTVEVSDGERSFELTFGQDADASAGLPIIGMRPARDSS